MPSPAPGGDGLERMVDMSGCVAVNLRAQSPAHAVTSGTICRLSLKLMFHRIGPKE